MKLMGPALVITAVLGIAALAHAQKDSAGQEQKQDLQGTWTATGTKGYNKDAARDFQNLQMTVKGDALIAKYGDKTARATYKLILTKAGPSQMDVTVMDGPEAVKGKPFKCIYLLEGNTLKVTYRDPGKERPSTFTDEGEAGVYTVFFKKEKN